MNMMILNGPSFPLTERGKRCADCISSEESVQLLRDRLKDSDETLTILLANPLRDMEPAPEAVTEMADWIKAFIAKVGLWTGSTTEDRAKVRVVFAATPSAGKVKGFITIPEVLTAGQSRSVNEECKGLMDSLGVVPMFVPEHLLKATEPKTFSGILRLTLQTCGPNHDKFDCPRVAAGAPAWTLVSGSGEGQLNVFKAPSVPREKIEERKSVDVDVSIADTLYSKSLEKYGSTQFSENLRAAYEQRRVSELVSSDLSKI